MLFYNIKYIYILYLLIIIFIYQIYYINIKIIDEKFKNVHSVAFCLLIRKPNIIWLDFLNSLCGNYDVFIAIDSPDDNSNMKKNYPNITFIEINDYECQKANYINSDYKFKPIVATDRAFYYFNRINTKHKHIWFCEDDIFFQSNKSLLNLDNQFPNTDLIVSKIEIHEDKPTETWHWSEIDNTLKLPWANQLICIVRISRKLMNKVDDFVKQHNKLIFKEILFHTLALHNKMEIQTPIEMSKIRLEKDWNILDIIDDKNKMYIYHPVKNLQKHIEIRQIK